MVFHYCHTRPRGKTHPIGWPKRWYYFLTNPPSHLASHPAANLLWPIWKSRISQQPVNRFYQNLKLKLRWLNQNKYAWNKADLQWKTTSNWRRSNNIKSSISQQQLIGSSSNFEIKLRWANENKYAWNEDDRQWKMTFNGRRSNDIKSWLSQQQLIGSSSNFKLKFRGPNQNKNAWIEDKLKWKRT